MSIRFAFAPLALLAALIVPTGCKSTDHHDDHGATASAAGTSEMTCAIYCDKCQTTFTKVPVVSGSGPRGSYGVVGYRTVSKHECDECRKVATDMMQSGKTMQAGTMVHKCKICGGEMRVCHQS